MSAFLSFHQGNLIIVVAISIPCLTDKDKHIAPYKINKNVIHTIQPYTLVLFEATYVWCRCA